MTNFKLKDCTDIIIDDKEVESITMLNEVVWEKTRSTQITFIEAPTEVEYSDSFSFKISVTDANNKEINGTVVLYDEDNNEITRKDTTDGIVNITTSSQTIGTNTYTATFLGTNKYIPSSTTTEINVKKKTTSFIAIGESIIYQGWYVGAKLTTNNGNTPLSNQEVKINIFKDYSRTTNLNGISTLKMRLLDGTYTITFTYEGNEYYLGTTMSRTYEMRQYTTEQVPLVDCILNDNQPDTQSWIKNNDTSFKCHENNLTVRDSGQSIHYNPDFKNKPSILTLTYNKKNINKIQKMELKYTVNQSPAIKNDTHGGWIQNAMVIINIGSGFEPGDGITTTNYDDYFSYDTNGNIDLNHYTDPTGEERFYMPPNQLHWARYDNETKQYSYGPVDCSIIWDFWQQSNDDTGRIISQNPVIKVIYENNHGSEEGFLTLTNLKFYLSYTPIQSTNFN